MAIKRVREMFIHTYSKQRYETKRILLTISKNRSDKLTGALGTNIGPPPPKLPPLSVLLLFEPDEPPSLLVFTGNPAAAGNTFGPRHIPPSYHAFRAYSDACILIFEAMYMSV